MFQNRNIVSAIEFGSSKICVLIGESGEDGRVRVIGRGEAPSAGIAKGEIVNMEAAFDQLALALDEADAASGGELNGSRVFVVPVTGCGIASHQGVGTVFIKNDSGCVTAAERAEAHQNARIRPMESDRIILNSAESYFVLDDRRQVRNPINQAACKLDAHVHIVHGIANRLANYQNVLRESGCEEGVDMVFAPLAAGSGILAEEERDSGVLLLDIGAGVTEYMIEFNTGLLGSGLIQIGFQHVINDLAIGLELPFDSCRKLVEDGSLARLMREQRTYVDFPSATGKVRRIPLASFETIIDQRLRELFTVIHQKIGDRALLARLNGGAVLTGGGAMFERTGRVFREVFDLTVRVGAPLDIGGAATGLESPRYSAVWGALKLAEYYRALREEESGGAFRRLIDGVDGVVSRMRRAVGGLSGSLRN